LGNIMDEKDDDDDDDDAAAAPRLNNRCVVGKRRNLIFSSRSVETSTRLKRNYVPTFFICSMKQEATRNTTGRHRKCNFTILGQLDRSKHRPDCNGVSRKIRGTDGSIGR
jgi:hypothetical protein